jgi:hypothetical protein
MKSKLSMDVCTVPSWYFLMKQHLVYICHASLLGYIHRTAKRLPIPVLVDALVEPLHVSMHTVPKLDIVDNSKRGQELLACQYGHCPYSLSKSEGIVASIRAHKTCAKLKELNSL